jgi:hypothetical protein
MMATTEKKGPLEEPPIWKEFLVTCGVLFGGGGLVGVVFILFVAAITS